MAKMRKLLTVLLVLCLVVSMLAVSVHAAPRKSDTSETHVYNSDNSHKVPFDKKDIVITIKNKDYRFTSSGSGTWKSLDLLPELNLPDEGEDASLPVIITDEDGIVYHAALINHSDKNGNNGNARPGTDTYDLSDVHLVDPEPQILEPDPIDPDPVEPEPTEPEPTEPEPTEPEPTEPEPTEPEPTEPEPTEPEPTEPEPTEPDSTEPEPTEPEPTEPDPTEPGPDPVPLSDDEPIADVPKTGDPSLLWAAVSALSAGGLALVNRKKKED